MARLFCLILTVIMHTTIIAADYDRLTDSVFSRAQIQYSALVRSLPDDNCYPLSAYPDGKLKYSSLDGWTEGFFPGSLWLIYEYTGNPVWREEAEARMSAMEEMKDITSHHDVGFLIGCSFGNAERLFPSEKYRQVIVDAANSLISRFDPAVGCIRSWDRRTSWDGNTWEYPVIIDNMMNLELLYTASRITGDGRYAAIADSHAEKTAKEHFRKDFSTWHVVDYDPETGKPAHKQTSQGYKDWSTWSRGQAWAIYGFTMTYRETGRELFLRTAMKAADFWINHKNLPEDLIPYWDFDAASGPRDAAAAAVTASALLELCEYAPSAGKRQEYRDFAVRTLRSLASEEYLAAPGGNNGFLLRHCTGSVPHRSEVDAPLIYADYYFLEALHRYRNSFFGGRRPEGIKLLQMNILQEGTVIEGGFGAIVDEIIRSDADIVFLEEIRNYNGIQFVPRLIAALAAKGAEYFAGDSSTDTAVLSKYPLEKSSDEGPERFYTEICGTKIAAYALHLDYRNYACFLPRGYDGNTWKKIGHPVTDSESVLAMNRKSGRPAGIAAVIEASSRDCDNGYAVVIAGDFNEPSHLDWGENTADLYDHNGAVIQWDCSTLLEKAGFRDVYRAVWPDPLENPGFTYPSNNPALAPERLTWAPEADERDRIDFIYILGNCLIPSSAEIYGPSSSIVRCSAVEESGNDIFITPAGTWPSDHKGVFANIVVSK